MKICQVSKADSFGGGASRVADELTQLLNQRGHEAMHLVSWSGKPLSPQRCSLYGRSAERIRKAHSWQKRLGFPELIPFELPVFLRRWRFLEYDLFHFHDLSSAISPLTLMFLARFRPVVWTIHDCSPFTGGCLYPIECEKFKSGCGGCPRLGEWPIDTNRDFTRFMRSVKKMVLHSGITCITPSNWMADMAVQSGALPRRPQVISNGIDTKLYSAASKEQLRKELGLPQDRLIFVLTSGNLDDPRKGLRFAVEALKKLQDLNPVVLLLGNPNPEFLQSLAPLEYRAPGYISDPVELARHYGCADFLLFCSMADNQPLAVIESLATGTPVVGFATGGVPELIVQNESGYLVSGRKIDELSAAVRKAVVSGDYKAWATNARLRAERQYSHTRLLENHVNLYKQLLHYKVEEPAAMVLRSHESHPIV